MSSIANDILMVVLAGLAGGLLARVFRQPLILGYILAGVLVGPYTTGFNVDVANIEKLADIGAALLLFSLGLEFPLRSLKPIRNIAFTGTLIQVGLTFLYGAVLARLFGFAWRPAFWFATAIISSSTAVILKTLNNQGHAESLSGRIMLGMSIVQDLSVIPVMILLSNISQVHEFSANLLLAVGRPVWYSVIFVLTMAIVGSRLTTYLLGWVARLNSRELFLLTITVLGLGVGYLTQLFGLSFAFGAFISGMVLSESDYSQRALSELVPVRDLFALLFFVSVGMLFDPFYLFGHFRLVIGIMLLAVFGRGLILAAISYVLGYRRVVPLALFFGMLPISEIAFVLIQTGASIGAFDKELYSLILCAVVTSMLIGPLLANLTAPVYRRFQKHGKEPPPAVVNQEEGELTGHVVVTGTNDYIPLLAEALCVIKLKHVFIVPEYALFCQLKSLGAAVIFGDPLLESVQRAARVSYARLMLVTNTSFPEVRRIIEIGREQNIALPIVAQANETEMEVKISRLPVKEVVQPHREAMVEMLRQILLHLNIDALEIQHYLDLLRHTFQSGGTQRGDGIPYSELAGLFNTAFLPVAPDSELNGCSLRNSRIRENYSVSVIGVVRGGELDSAVSADYVFEPGDKIVVMGRLKDCEAFITANSGEPLNPADALPA